MRRETRRGETRGAGETYRREYSKGSREQNSTTAFSHGGTTMTAGFIPTLFVGYTRPRHARQTEPENERDGKDENKKTHNEVDGCGARY